MDPLKKRRSPSNLNELNIKKYVDPLKKRRSPLNLNKLNIRKCGPTQEEEESYTPEDKKRCRKEIEDSNYFVISLPEWKGFQRPIQWQHVIMYPRHVQKTRQIHQGPIWGHGPAQQDWRTRNNSLSRMKSKRQYFHLNYTVRLLFATSAPIAASWSKTLS